MHQLIKSAHPPKFMANISKTKELKKTVKGIRIIMLEIGLSIESPLYYIFKISLNLNINE